MIVFAWPMSLALGRRSAGPEMHTEPSKAQRKPKTGADTVATFFSLLADGSVAKVSQFFTSYGPSGPDGLAVDMQGRVLVANPGLGYVWVLNTRAEPVMVLRGPARRFDDKYRLRRSGHVHIVRHRLHTRERADAGTRHPRRLAAQRDSRQQQTGHTMTAELNETHDPALRSWVISANQPDCDFPQSVAPRWSDRGSRASLAFLAA